MRSDAVLGNLGWRCAVARRRQHVQVDSVLPAQERHEIAANYVCGEHVKVGGLPHALVEDAVNPLYEWQLRAYMMLYDKPCAELIYCMVTTWDEFLNEYENLQLHRVDHINPEKRITALWYDRDEDIEAKMVARLKEASDLYHEYYEQLNNK